VLDIAKSHRFHTLGSPSIYEHKQRAFSSSCVWKNKHTQLHEKCGYKYRSADKSLARPGRKQGTATEDFDVHVSYYYHNWSNISTIYIYIYRGANKPLARPGRKQRQKILMFMYPIIIIIGGILVLFYIYIYIYIHSGAVKSLARPGRKQATATEVFDVHISYHNYNHSWRNISTIYIYNKTSIKWNILTIKQNPSGCGVGYVLTSTPVCTLNVWC
jgi:hypothetical protein